MIRRDEDDVQKVGDDHLIFLFGYLFGDDENNLEEVEYVTTEQLRGSCCFHCACLVVPKMPMMAGMMIPGKDCDTMEERPNRWR